MENEETADREQWTHGLHSHCKDRFTDQIRDGQEQRRWPQTIEEWAERDPLQGKPHIQVTETFAALAEMKTARGPGGDQATVEVWQNLPIQLKPKGAAHFDRYLAMPRHVNQPDKWRQVPIQKQAGADDFDEHRYLSLLAQAHSVTQGPPCSNVWPSRISTNTANSWNCTKKQSRRLHSSTVEHLRGEEKRNV